MARFLIAGSWHSTIHEEPIAQALRHLGHSVVEFRWHGYFGSLGQPVTGPLSIGRRFQAKFMVGPRFKKLNHALVHLAACERPDVLLVYRGSHVTLETLRRIRDALPRAILVGHNNDDPFSPRYPAWMWRHFLRALPEYDLVLAYRNQNLVEFQGSGARQVRLWRSWFVPERNRRVALSGEDQKRYGCDVVFVGHYEADHRIGYLDAVAREGHHLRVFGPDYPACLESKPLSRLLPIQAVRDEEYNKALCGAKVALSFLSKLNRDTYTRRNFEIPATETMMLSEYSEDLTDMFRDGVEAVFFRSPEELTSKLALYLASDGRRRSVAAEGYRRVWADGHDVLSRTRQLVDWLCDLGMESHAPAC